MPRSALCVRSRAALDGWLFDFCRSVQESGRLDPIHVWNAPQDAALGSEFPCVALDERALATLDLPRAPQVFWRCGDYFLYAARAGFPQFDFYWLMDDDVVVNAEAPAQWLAEIDRATEADFIAPCFRPAGADWGWTAYMEYTGLPAYRSFFPLVRVSGKALDFLAVQRRAAYATAFGRDPGKLEAWPNDEAFVATMLANHGFRCVELNAVRPAYVEEDFAFGRLRHVRELPPRDGRLHHPVTIGDRYLDKAVATVNPGNLAAILGNALEDCKAGVAISPGALSAMLTAALAPLGDDATAVFDWLGPASRAPEAEGMLWEPLAAALSRLGFRHSLEALPTFWRSKASRPAS